MAKRRQKCDCYEDCDCPRDRNRDRRNKGSARGPYRCDCPDDCDCCRRRAAYARCCDCVGVALLGGLVILAIVLLIVRPGLDEPASPPVVYFHRYAFTTRGLYTGDFGSAEQGDEICEQEAATSTLGYIASSARYWKAILASEDFSEEDGIVQRSAKYRFEDPVGTTFSVLLPSNANISAYTVFWNVTDFFDPFAPLTHLIPMNEDANGTVLTGEPRIYTGEGIDGGSVLHCEEWTSTVDVSRYGNMSESSFKWLSQLTSGPSVSCANTLRLMCMQDALR